MEPLGTVEAETRAFIAELGKLSPRYRTLAAQAIALAMELDDRVATSPSAKPGLNRQLTLTMDRLREAEHVRPATPEAEVEDEVEKARKARAERLATQEIQEGSS